MRCAAFATMLLFGCARGVERRVPAPPDDARKPAPPATAPLFEGKPPARTVLQPRVLGVSPDGRARWLVRVSFVDASGRKTKLLRGGDVAFVARGGRVQWQTRVRFGGPAAIVSTTRDGLLALEVTPRVGTKLAPLRTTTDTRAWHVARVVAAALGPRLVQLGWFPPVAAGTVRIARETVRTERSARVRSGSRLESGPEARAATVSLVDSSASTYRDVTAQPGETYRYRISLPGRAAVALDVRVPATPAHGSIAVLAGKAMWLSFSPSPLDDDAYSHLDPAQVVAQAHDAGLAAIELRTGYGPFWEITPTAKPTLDALIDAAAARGIRMLGWTIPRSTDFDDLAAAVRTAQYRTARGNGFSALAVDLERGEEYLGRGAAGRAALTDYLRLLRAALGPGYPLVATVEDPSLEHLSNDVYPYAAIAASADALQPMTYWRMLSKRVVTPQAVREALRASYAATRREARRAIPIDVGGQTSPEGPRGGPPPDEIAASVAEAKALGALGITFFDWRGTSAQQWRALAQTPWATGPADR